MEAPPYSLLVSNLHFSGGPLLPPRAWSGVAGRTGPVSPTPTPGLLWITVKVTSIGCDRPDPYQDPCLLSWGSSVSEAKCCPTGHHSTCH